MNKEIKRAQKHAKAASAQARPSSQSLYRSPLRAGFSFDGWRPVGEETHPYLQRGERHHNGLDNNNNSIVRVVYEEVYINMNREMDLNGATRQRCLSLSGKKYVVERMKDRRRNCMSEWGDPNPYWRRNNRGADDNEGSQSMGCIVI